MSRYSMEYLNTNFLRGMTETHGKAWWTSKTYQARQFVGASGKLYTGTTYPGPIPVADVLDRLPEFRERFEGRRVAVEIPADESNFTHFADDGSLWRWAVQDNRKAMVLNGRDQAAGQFAESYADHQYNDWLLKLTSDVLSGADLYSIGLLDGGNAAFAMFGIDGMTVGQNHGFTVLPHYLAATSFNGKLSTTGKLVSTFAECDNTFAWAMGEGTPEFKRLHRRGKFTAEMARDALGLVVKYADDLNADFEMLASVPVTDNQWANIRDELTPLVVEGKSKRGLAVTTTQVERKRDELNTLWSGSDETSPKVPNALGVIQTVSTWNLWHSRTNEGTDRMNRNTKELITGKGAEDDAATFAAIVKVMDLDVSGMLDKRDRLVSV